MVSTFIQLDTSLCLGRVRVAPSELGRTAIWLDGEHDISTVALLIDALADVSRFDNDDVVVDLSGVTFLTSATIEALVRGQEAFRRGGRRLALRSPSRAAVRLIDICGLGHLVEPDEHAPAQS